MGEIQIVNMASSCVPGFAPPNCTVTFADLYPEQWIGMRVLTLLLPPVGLIVGALLIWEYYRKGDLVFPKVNLSVVGLLCVEMAFLLLLFHFAVDPGSLNAKTGGYVSKFVC